MKNKLKQILVLLVTIIVIGALNTVYGATTGEVVLTSNKSEYNTGDTVVISVNFSNFNTDENMVEFGGKIVYDTNALELQKVTTNRDAGWDLAVEGSNYQKTTGGFSFGAGKIDANSKAFELEFKVKSDFTGTAKISITDMDVNERKDFGSAETSIKVVEKTSNPSTDKEDEKENTENDGDKEDNNKKPSTDSDKNKDNTVSKEKLPQTGVTGNTLILTLISISVIIMIAFLVRIIKINTKIKKMNK